MKSMTPEMRSVMLIRRDTYELRDEDVRALFELILEDSIVPIPVEITEETLCEYVSRFKLFDEVSGEAIEITDEILNRMVVKRMAIDILMVCTEGDALLPTGEGQSDRNNLLGIQDGWQMKDDGERMIKVSPIVFVEYDEDEKMLSVRFRFRPDNVNQEADDGGP